MKQTQLVTSMLEKKVNLYNHKKKLENDIQEIKTILRDYEELFSCILGNISIEEVRAKLIDEMPYIEEYMSNSDSGISITTNEGQEFVIVPSLSTYKIFGRKEKLLKEFLYSDDLVNYIRGEIEE